MKRWALLYAICVVGVRVITDPYAGLNYTEINTYEFEQTYLENCIGYHEPEDSADDEDEEPEEPIILEERKEPVFIPWRFY